MEMPKYSHRKDIEMKKVLTVLLVSISSLLLCALIVFGVFLMKIPVTQKSIDLLEKGMTFAEVFEVLKSDIIITPISEADVEKAKYELSILFPNDAINYLGEDYETFSWRQYQIFEWQMENEDSFMIFFGRETGADGYGKLARLSIKRSEWEREKNEGREFNENNENIKMKYVYVYAVNEHGLVASWGDNDSVFIEYVNADKFFNHYCSLAVYYDESTFKKEDGYIDDRIIGRTNYLHSVKAVSIRFTDPEKGEPQFG